MRRRKGDVGQRFSRADLGQAHRIAAPERLDAALAIGQVPDRMVLAPSAANQVGAALPGTFCLGVDGGGGGGGEPDEGSSPAVHSAEQNPE